MQKKPSVENGPLRHYFIPFENLVGFAADTTSNMFGEHNSVVSRLRENFPNITIIKCICHSIHLCASEAAKTLPKKTEDIVRNIYSFFPIVQNVGLSMNV